MELTELQEGYVMLLLFNGIIFFIGLAGAAFGIFFGGLRGNYQLVTGCWARVLGTAYLLLSAPGMVVGTLGLLPRRPGWFNDLEAWATEEGNFREEWILVALVWAVALLLIGIISLAVPDRKPRKSDYGL